VAVEPVTDSCADSSVVPDPVKVLVLDMSFLVADYLEGPKETSSAIQVPSCCPSLAAYTSAVPYPVEAIGHHVGSLLLEDRKRTPKKSRGPPCFPLVACAPEDVGPVDSSEDFGSIQAVVLGGGALGLEGEQESFDNSLVLTAALPLFCVRFPCTPPSAW